ncbi:MAG TPA: TIR domain-containing protein, partial [Candidatus Bathyarchaeia archaeon]|nr:TIR domain-containing protein [Candidatus Bathyarchaeia archaeon]
TNASLEGARVHYANLEGSILTGVRIFDASFQNCSLRNVTCEYVDIQKRGEGSRRLPEDRDFEDGEFEEFFGKYKDIYSMIESDVKERREMNHAFISYVNEDIEAATRLCDDLRKSGIKVWIDSKMLQPGAKWQAAIRNAIQDGAFFIACFSQKYSRRDKSYMNKELRIAVDKMMEMPNDRVWFIPVKLSPCDIPDFSIGGNETFRDIQWVDLSQDWAEGVQRIVHIIKGD